MSEGETYWYEAWLRPGATPLPLYRRLDPLLSFGGGFVHHFYDEPWWRGAYVVRVGVTEDLNAEVKAALASYPDVVEWARWESVHDEQTFGSYWPWAASFFQAGSVLSTAANQTQAHRGKMVHCYLNAQGLSWGAEIRFHIREALMRTWLWIKYLPSELR